MSTAAAEFLLMQGISVLCEASFIVMVLRLICESLMTEG